MGAVLRVPDRDLSGLAPVQAVEASMSQRQQIEVRLKDGETVTYREHGNSMAPKLLDGVQVTLAPCMAESVRVGDIVFAKVRGRYFLHYVTAKAKDGSVQIGNARGHVNGWTRSVFGVVVDYNNPGKS